MKLYFNGPGLDRLTRLKQGEIVYGLDTERHHMRFQVQMGEEFSWKRLNTLPTGETWYRVERKFDE